MGGNVVACSLSPCMLHHEGGAGHVPKAREVKRQGRGLWLCSTEGMTYRQTHNLSIIWSLYGEVIKMIWEIYMHTIVQSILYSAKFWAKIMWTFRHNVYKNLLLFCFCL